MEDLFIFITAFFLIFTLLLGNYFWRKRQGKLPLSKEVNFIVYRSKIKRSSINYNSFGLLCVLVNSLIIASVGTFVSALKINYVFQLLLGFLFLFGMIYVVYGFIGIYMKRREDKK